MDEVMEAAVIRGLVKKVLPLARCVFRTDMDSYAIQSCDIVFGTAISPDGAWQNALITIRESVSHSPKLSRETQPAWEKNLDALGWIEGFRDRLSRCVDNLEEFAGLTPREALQQGWYDYAEDDGE